MVDSLKGHPGIVAWEIFNEPEGMSNDYYFYASDPHVPDTVIQRFINLCAGAIHRTDPNAKVTNGAWSFKSLSPASYPAALGKVALQYDASQKKQMEIEFARKYRVSMTADEVIQYLQRISLVQNYNWYSDNQLIRMGGDSLGTLDFHEVHYYTWGGTPLSPFHHPAVGWGTGKAIVVAEFAMEQITSTFGIPQQQQYDSLYHSGYAGAMSWSWTDVGLTTHADMVAGAQYMWDNHRSDVDVLGNGVDWPAVTITSPPNNGTYPDSTQISIRTMVIDTLAVDSVTFFVADKQRIGSVTVPDSMVGDTSYYTFSWVNIPAGQYSLKAVATNNHGHQGISNIVLLSFGMPPMTRLEAERVPRQGDLANISVGSGMGASSGAYLDIKTNDPNTTITWTFTNVAPADSYYVSFGYMLHYDHPKGQYINVNDVRVAELIFDGSSASTWYEAGLKVYLISGTNAIQMQLSWGWIYLDYLAVPTKVLTSINSPSDLPLKFSLQQNYPNPFNPGTTIKYSIASAGHVKLVIFDLLGRQVATLVNQSQNPGFYEVPFDAQKFTSGVYFYRIESGSFIQTKKMLLLK
jgi:hypothetical protein